MNRGSERSPVARALQQLLHSNHHWLEQTASALDVELTGAALSGAITGLRRALEAVAVAVIEPELRAAIAIGARVPGDEPSWAERWQRFPGAAARLGMLVEQWRAHVGELLARLRVDHDGLCERLELNRLPPLIELVTDVGDRHDHGRSVVLLGFAGGSGVVYKPKDLRVAVAVLELFEALSTAGFEPKLARQWLWSRSGYAWEQRLANRACSSPAELRRFYQRLGGYLRVFQLLGASDLWMDNLIAVGEHPMFIDLETALGPTRARDLDGSAEADARKFIDESVIGMSLLRMPVAAAAGLPSEDLGGLARPGWFRTPYRADARLRELALGEQTPSRDGFLLWYHDQHAPTLAGEAVDAWQFGDEISTGYRRAHVLLCEHGEWVDRTLDSLAAVPLRFIHRHTWFYGRILRKLMTATMLRELAAAERLFAALRAEVPAREAAIFNAELVALRRLDVPYFSVLGDGCDLFDATAPEAGPIARAEFEHSSIARVRARLATIPEFPLERHAELVAGLVALAGPRAQSDPCPTSAGDPLTDAIGFGDELLALAFAGRDGSLAWVGLDYDPIHQRESIDVLTPNLLTGSSGIALAFAELYAASNEQRFAKAARAALAPTLVALSSWRPAAIGLAGLAGQLHALRCCARWLDAPELRAAGRTLALELPLAELARGSTDFVRGSSALLLALLGYLPDRELAAACVPVLRSLERVGEHTGGSVAGLPETRTALAWIAQLSVERLDLQLDWRIEQAEAPRRWELGARRPPPLARFDLGAAWGLAAQLRDRLIEDGGIAIAPIVWLA